MYSCVNQRFLISWVSGLYGIFVIYCCKKNYPSLKQQTYPTEFLRVRNQGVAYLHSSLEAVVDTLAGCPLSPVICASLSASCTAHSQASCWREASVPHLGLSKSCSSVLMSRQRSSPRARSQEQGRSHDAFYFWLWRHTPSLLPYSVH